MNNKIKTIFCITFFIFLCNEIFYAQQTRQKKEIKKETVVQPEKKEQIKEEQLVSKEAIEQTQKKLSIFNLGGDIRLRFEHINNAKDFNSDTDDLDEDTRFRTRLLIYGELAKVFNSSIRYNCVFHKYNRLWGEEGTNSITGTEGETIDKVEKNIKITEAFLEIGDQTKLFLGKMPVGLEMLSPLYSYDSEYKMVEEKDPLLFFVADTIMLKIPVKNFGSLSIFNSTLEEAGLNAGNLDKITQGVIYRSVFTTSSGLPFSTNIFLLRAFDKDWFYTLGGKLNFSPATDFNINGTLVLQTGKVSSVETNGKAFMVEAKFNLKDPAEELGLIYASGSADDPQTSSTDEGFYDLNFSPEYSFAEIYGMNIHPNIGIQGISLLRLSFAVNLSFLSEILNVEGLGISKVSLKNNKIRLYYLPLILSNDPSDKEKNIGSEIDIHLYPSFWPELVNSGVVKWRITYALFFPGGYWQTAKKDTVQKFLFETYIKF